MFDSQTWITPRMTVMKVNMPLQTPSLAIIKCLSGHGGVKIDCCSACNYFATVTLKTHLASANYHDAHTALTFVTAKWPKCRSKR